MTPEEKKERKRLYDIEYNKNNAIKRKEQGKRWREMNQEKKRLYGIEYTKANQEKKRLYDIEYRKTNQEKKRLTNRTYYLKNKDKLLSQVKNYRVANREAINLKVLTRKQTDPLFKLMTSIRSLVKESFKWKGLRKRTKTELMLGCSFKELKEHLESQFEPWMNWDNYGNPKDGILELNKTWDIDHIVPLSTGKTEDEIIKLTHYTNLQPLCSYTNRYIKRDKQTWNS